MLCDIFEGRMKGMTCTLLRKDEFNLEDFHNAKERELDAFTFTMENIPAPVSSSGSVCLGPRARSYVSLACLIRKGKIAFGTRW
jgi:hypothetical protein